MRIFGFNVFVMVNFILTLLIFSTGCWAYIKTKNKVPFYIGVAFGLFSLSHLMVLMGIHRNLRESLILMRSFGYFIVLITLYRMGRKSV